MHFYARQMLDKIKYNQAGVQICTPCSLSNCTLGRWVYKFVHAWLGERDTNLYTLDWERGVQICTRLTGREGYKFVHAWLGERGTIAMQKNTKENLDYFDHV